MAGVIAGLVFGVDALGSSNSLSIAMIVLGVALQRYMGIAPRKSHFRDPKDDPKS